MAGKIDGVFVELKATVDDAGVVKAEQKITNSAKKIQAEFKKTDAALSGTSSQLARHNKNLGKSSKAMGGMGRSAGQAGIQLQQFTGQVQGGVNPLIAFSQQAADLGIVMGAPLLGVVASMAAGLALVLLPEIFNASKATSELTDKLKDLKAEQVLTTDQAKFLAASLAAENKEKQKKIKEIDKEIVKLNALIKLQKEQRDSEGFGRSAAANRRTANKRIEETNLLLGKQKAALDTLKQETGELAVISADIEKAKQDAIKKTAAISESLTQQIAIASITIESGASAARRLALAFELGFQNASQLSQPIKDSLTALEAVEAQQTANEERNREELQKTAKLKSELKAQEAKTTSEFEKLESSFGTELEQIESKLIAERELTKAYFLLELEDAKGNADALLAVEQRKADATAAIEKNAADAKTRLEQAKKQTTLGYASSTFGALSSLMNTESRKLFEIGKAAAIGQAIVDGYAAVSKTMASVPYPFNVPLAIAQGAASAVQVQGIAKQKFGGSGGGAGTFSSGMPAVRTTDAGSTGGGGNQNINISGIDRNSLISGGQLVDTLNQALGDGFTINFAGG